MKSVLRVPFSRKSVESAPAVVRSYGFEGVTFTPPPGCEGDWLRRPLDRKGQESMVVFLGQVEEEGFARLLDNNQLRLTWDAVYELGESVDHGDALSLMGLPPVLAWQPRLESQHGLEDKEFVILLAGWIAPNGVRMTEDLRLNGAVVTWRGEESLLSNPAWLTVEAIAVFYRRWQSERTGDANRRGWAKIRKHARAANADLSNFLASTVVLTPDKLQLRLRKGNTAGKLVEVIPEFADAPSGWIDCFDRGDQVLDRYDIPQGAGIVQVMLPPEVRSVLREIKAMPGRRVAGARAEAFVRNPFATLGPDASTILDPAEFEAERQRAGLCFARFTPELLRDPQGMLREVVLHIERSGAAVSSNPLHIVTVTELVKFVTLLSERIAQEAQCCVWHGNELEILGETRDHLASLETALTEWRKQEHFTLGEILDLSQYSGRIEGIGVEKAYYSPFIARNHTSQWFPEEVSYGVTWQQQDGSEAMAMRMSEEALNDFKVRLEVARKSHADVITVPGLPMPMPFREGERILCALQAARVDVASGTVHAERLKPIKRELVRKQLVLRSNVETIDYEERRGVLLLEGAAPPDLPAALEPKFPLKPHQAAGLQWLQHLFAHSPADCRGALLADDMGLGKTLQILAFIAHRLQVEPNADPFLIVAPVALLENWKEEMQKFFVPGTLPVLALYGPVLAGKRLPREAVEAEIGQAGLGRLLVRNWLGDARIVLTTYETLRDLEFSFARQKWSAMICDEAQKIKNPNSMVSRAAKKQNARFKIACTGTPVENSLVDLWCLFDFIQPGLLGALATFGQAYRRPIEARSEAEASRLKELRALIEPQKLRRTKAEVARDLPAKIVVEGCRGLCISPWQRSLYGEALRRFREDTPSAEPQGGGSTLKLLMHLRALCTDPHSRAGPPAISVTIAELEEHSPKMAWLLGELKKIRARQEKVIIFCEFRDLQRTLQRAVGERLQLVPDVINGQTSSAADQSNNRQRKVAQFQAKPGFGVIILSPLAVGFGLNIQGANHVVHFTRGWNPAKEDQATDRAYRIGQTRDVFVYYPVVTAPDFKTFDAILDQLLEQKRALSRDMLNGAGDLLPHEFGDLQHTGARGKEEDFSSLSC